MEIGPTNLLIPLNNSELIYASEHGHLEIVKYLVKHGIDIHAQNDEALKTASVYGHLEIVKYLMEHGADIHGENEYALRWASNGGHLEVVRYLIEHDADIHAEDDEALQWASEEGYLEVVKYLKEEIKRRLVNELIIPYFCISKASPQIRIEEIKRTKVKSAIPKEIIRKIIYLSKYQELNENELQNNRVKLEKLSILEELMNVK